MTIRHPAPAARTRCVLAVLFAGAIGMLAPIATASLRLPSQWEVVPETALDLLSFAWLLQIGVLPLLLLLTSAQAALRDRPLPRLSSYAPFIYLPALVIVLAVVIGTFSDPATVGRSPQTNLEFVEENLKGVLRHPPARATVDVLAGDISNALLAARALRTPASVSDATGAAAAFTYGFLSAAHGVLWPTLLATTFALWLKDQRRVDASASRTAARLLAIVSCWGLAAWALSQLLGLTFDRSTSGYTAPSAHLAARALVWIACALSLPFALDRVLRIASPEQSPQSAA